MYYDITGLPPSAEAVTSVTRDETFNVDALASYLLKQNSFGERWARHWLDVARYADSDGYENDNDRRQAY